MQEVHEPGRRPGQQFAGVDLRRPKGYAAAPASQAAGVGEGDPCPRCESRDTKFCYYNNYNTSQPRHFCKGCRRYWTKGGTLRNVPVGGGTRKKPSSSLASASSASPPAPAAKPKKPYKKKRRVAPPEPSATPAAPVAADSAKVKTETRTTPTTTTTTTTPADAASEITTELMAPVVEDESLAHLLQPDDAATAAAVALGLGLSDLPAGKGLGFTEPDSFEWPPAFDLGSYWGNPAAFADPDPAMFLNLP